MGQVYVITNLINGKRYVGITVGAASQRWAKHLNDAKNGSRYKFHRAIRKHGADNFSVRVLFHSDDYAALKAKEIHYVQVYDSFHNGMNSTLGGNGALGCNLNPQWMEAVTVANRRKAANPAFRGTMKALRTSQTHREVHKNAMEARSQDLQWRRNNKKANQKRLACPTEVQKQTSTKRLISAYARRNGITISEAFKKRSRVIHDLADTHSMKYIDYVAAIHAGTIPPPPNWPLCLSQ